MKIYENCISEESKETIHLMIFAPLEAVIYEESNKDAKEGAVHCLYEFFIKLAQGNKVEVIDFLSPKCTALFYVST